MMLRVGWRWRMYAQGPGAAGTRRGRRTQDQGHEQLQPEVGAKLVALRGGGGENTVTQGHTSWNQVLEWLREMADLRDRLGKGGKKPPKVA